MNYFYLVPAASLFALGFAYYFYKRMMRESEGTKMKTIAQYVREGAMSYPSSNISGSHRFCCIGCCFFCNGYFDYRTIGFRLPF